MRRGPGGVTFGETLVALVILSIAVFATLGVNVYTLKAAQGNRNRQIANMIASTQLGFVESVLKVNFHVPDSDLLTPKLNSVAYPDFDYIIDDVKYEDPGRSLRHARVRVFWEEKGVQHSYALATTFYNY